MKYTAGYKAVSRIRLDYLIQYKYCWCGTSNTDTTQSVEFSSEKSGNAFANTERLKQEASSAMMNSFSGRVQEVQDSIQRRDYKKLGLICACSNCHKLQPWSDFRDEWIVFKIIAALGTTQGSVILMFWAVIGLFLLGAWKHWIWAVIIVLLAIPVVMAIVHNIKTNKQIATMPAECIPEITLLAPGVSARSAVPRPKLYEPENDRFYLQ